jgi:uncharacterized protein YfdQ (DUF2303 family)
MQTSDIQAALDAGQRLANINFTGEKSSVALAVVPENAHIDKVDLEPYLSAPRRANKIVKVNTPESFVLYFGRFALTSSIVALNAEKLSGTFVGLIDYHSKESPAWCAHRLEYKPQETPEWKLWQENDKHVFKQNEFAEFLEENLPDISNPASADLLEVAKSIQARRSTNFKSDRRLDNGDRALVWEETTQASAKQGELEIPAQFTITFPLFHGGDPASIAARLKFRIDSGAVVFWYELVRPHKAVETQLETLKQIIVNGIGDHDFIEGVI